MTWSRTVLVAPVERGRRIPADFTILPLGPIRRVRTEIVARAPESSIVVAIFTMAVLPETSGVVTWMPHSAT